MRTPTRRRVTVFLTVPPDMDPGEFPERIYLDESDSGIALVLISRLLKDPRRMYTWRVS